MGVCLVLSSLGIAAFLAILGQSFWLSAWTQGSIDAAAFNQSHSQSQPPASVSQADLKKAVEAAVDESVKRDELLIDKLLLVVSLYSTILSVLALATVFASRQDAKDQLASVNARAEALASELKTQLAEIRSKAQSDIDDLKSQVKSEFPIISRLQDRVQSLILDLEDRFPEDENLNKPRPDSWPSAESQQRSLIDEAQILAVSVVALDDASLLKLYLALARFYFDRFRTGGYTPSDAARAHIYASRAIKCSPGSADAYRMRGATTLSRFDAPSKMTLKKDEIQDLLQLARTDFNKCIELDEFNAGALYNLSLISLFEFKDLSDKPDESIPHLDKAIQFSESLLAASKDVSRKAKEKYFPDVYINLACFFAYKWKIAADPALQAANPALQQELVDRVVKVCTDGRDFLNAGLDSSKAKNNFKASLERELDTQGDVAGLPQDTRAKLQSLLTAPWDKPVP
jgi:hypothetical protein